jgi:outer membrane protein assembly factor BamB
VYGEARGVPALAADGTVYVATRFGKLYALDQAGTIRWQYDVGSEICSDAVPGRDGVVHVQTYGPGVCIYSINVPSGLADAPWPMYLHDPQHTGRAGP